MHDRYRDADSPIDSRESRGGSIDSGDSLANTPIVSGLMVAAAVAVVIILAGTM